MMAMVGITPMRIAGKGVKWMWGKSKPFTIAVVVAIGAVKIGLYIQKQQRRKKWNAVGRDVVVLHCFPRGRFCPNLSPFVLKLETYLRMADIPYELDFEEPMGPKGKSPWITLNGEEIADSQIVMDRLGPKYGKNFSSHLTAEEKVLGRALQIMMEDHFLWSLVLWRYVTDNGRGFLLCMEVPIFFRLFIIPMFKHRVRKALWLQGTGRHSRQEIENMGRQDLQDLSMFLGEKKFLMGEEATEVDCAIFGMLSQIVWNSPGSPYLQMLDTEFTNLSSYCHRMKEKFWPDWDQCLNPPREAVQE